MTWSDGLVLTLVVLLIPLPLLLIWGWVVVDILGQPSLSVAKKIGWLAACTFIWPTQILYILVRPQRGRAVLEQEADNPHGRFVRAVLDHESGRLTDADFEATVGSLRS